MKVGDIVLIQHKGYNGEKLFSKNVYDYFTRPILFIWRIKSLNTH